MQLINGEFYHVYNRGNNRQPIFFNEHNYLYFLKKTREQLLPCSNLICYCLMPNHFHLVIEANQYSIKERKSFGSKSMQEFAYRTGILLSSYTQAINNQNGTSGSLFQQKTKAKILSEEVDGVKENYIENAFFYVHYNPYAAGIVNSLRDWPYSSYLDYIGERNGTLCDQSIFLNLTGLTKSDIIKRSEHLLPEQEIQKFYLKV